MKQKRLVGVIIRFSAPMWFYIKCNPLAVQGPKNLFKAIQLVRELEVDEKRIAKKVLQRNGWFCHPDQVVLAMFADEDEDVRCRGVDLVKTFREKQTGQAEKKARVDRGVAGEVEDIGLAADDTGEDLVDNDGDYEENDSVDSVRQVVIPQINWECLMPVLFELRATLCVDDMTALDIGVCIWFCMSGRGKIGHNGSTT